jgi:hypothetical protein
MVAASGSRVAVFPAAEMLPLKGTAEPIVAVRP